MKVLSDYAEEPNGMVFVEFEWFEGYREKLILPRAEAERIVAENEAYLDSHPEEVEEYNRVRDEELARYKEEEEEWMRAREEAEELERILAEEQYYTDLERRATRRQHSRKCLTFRPERSIL